MAVDFDIMAKVQAELAPELYAALCAYINHRESAEWQDGYDEGMAQGYNEGFDAKE